MLIPTTSKQAGFTLIELMIGSLVALLVLAGVLSVFSATTKSSSDNLRMSRLNQELRAIMLVMVNDIRRAGHSGITPGFDVDGDGDVDLDDLSYNPFTAGNYDLSISGGNCISYSYNYDSTTDADEIGAAPLIGVGPAGSASATTDTDNSELFGFRLNSTDNTVEMRRSGNTASDAIPGCNNGAWEAINSPEIAISALSFTLNTSTLNITSPGTACASGDDCQDIRRVDISLTGQTFDGLNQLIAQQTISGSSKIRNSRYYTVP